MDPTQTGAWIAARRKEKNLTQKDLADRLGVTDKAVSRWETGKGYPDVALLPALAAELDCTVNELLSGKRLSPEEVPAAAEENLAALCRTAGQPLPNDRGLFRECRLVVGEDRLEIRPGAWQIAASVFVLLLAAVAAGMVVLVSVVGASDQEMGTMDLVGLIFLSAWFLLVLGLACTVLLLRPIVLTMDREGVSAKSLIRTKRLAWTSIRDYGVAYGVHDRLNVRYLLYFSDTVLSSDDEGRKQHTRSCVKILLDDAWLDRSVGRIMDFCAKRTDVLPFLVYPYDRIRFQGTGSAAPQGAPAHPAKGDRWELPLAFGAAALGGILLVSERIRGGQGGSRLLAVAGGIVCVLAGLAVMWAELRRLHRAGKDGLRVEQVDWTTLLERWIAAALALALGIAVLIVSLLHRG